MTSAGGGSARFPSSVYGEPGTPLPPASPLAPVAPLAPEGTSVPPQKRRRRLGRGAERSTWPGASGPNGSGASGSNGSGAPGPSGFGASRPTGRSAGRRVAGSALIGLWAAWVAAAAWTGPWPASAEDLRVAAETGAIASWSTQRSAPADGLTESGFFAGRAHGTSASTAGVVVRWEDGWHRARWADASPLAGAVSRESLAAGPSGAGPTSTVDRSPNGDDTHLAGANPTGANPTGANPTGTDTWPNPTGTNPTGANPTGTDTWPNPQSRAVEAWLGERAGAPRWTDPGPLGIVPGAVFWLAGLLFILAGPPPRHGNRWYWFWVGGLGYGVGLVAYAVAELISDRPPTHAARSGLRGLVTAFVGSVVVSGAAGLLLHVLGLA